MTHDAPTTTDTTDTRTPWIAPTVDTIAAGDAEAGPGGRAEGQSGLS